jgi:arginase
MQTFSPDELRRSTGPLLTWLVAATGCPRIAIHFDVHTVESNEIVLGLGVKRSGRIMVRLLDVRAAAAHERARRAC